MATSLGDVRIDIRSRDTSFQRNTKRQRAEIRKLRTDLRRARRTIAQYRKSLSDTARTAARFATGAVAAVGAGLAAIGASASRSLKEIQVSANNLRLSLETFQLYQSAGEIVGATNDDIADSLQTLSVRFEEAREGTGEQLLLFNKMGISLRDIRDTVGDFPARLQLFQERLAAVTDQNVRLEVLDALLGDVGRRTLPVFADSTRVLADAARQLEATGGHFSNFDIQAIDDIRIAFGKLTGRIFTEGVNVLRDYREELVSIAETLLATVPPAFEALRKAIAAVRENFDLVVTAARAFVSFKIGVAAARAVTGVLQLAGAIRTLAAAGQILTISNPATAVAGLAAAVVAYRGIGDVIDNVTQKYKLLALEQGTLEDIAKAEAEAIQRVADARAAYNKELENPGGGDRLAVLQDDIRIAEEQRAAVTAVTIARREELRAQEAAIAAAQAEATQRTQVVAAVKEEAEARQIILTHRRQSFEFLRREEEARLRALRIQQAEIDAQNEQARIIRDAANIFAASQQEQRAEYEATGRALRTQLEDMRNQEQLLTRAADNIANAFGNSISNIINGFESLGQSAKKLAQTIISELSRVAIIQPIIDLLGGNLRNFIGLGGLVGRQFGGPVRRGQPYLVGEGGGRPELFIPNQDGNIISNSDLRRGSGVTTVQIPITIYGNPDPEGLSSIIRTEVSQVVRSALGNAQYRNI